MPAQQALQDHGRYTVTDLQPLRPPDAGCLNGGGQLRPGKGETPQQLLERLEAAYYSEGSSSGVELRWPQDSPEAAQVGGRGWQEC